ncbi:MAG: hypothetical protein BroJett030_03260 [Alphaproteobacteria bacterium]|nr:MAG: hypothetical protein BroJett030_03260 [Alphaproteobacteria bacterium]
MARLSLSRANRVVSLIFAEARTRGLKPLAVVVLDTGGSVKTAQTQDGVPFGRFEVAAGKARGALFTGSASRTLHAMAGERPHFLQGVASVLAGGIVPVPGGVTIRSPSGQVLGAVGVSGDTSDNDEAAAAAAIARAGLVAGSVG